MRNLLWIGVLCLSALCSADRYALLVGIDQYLKIKGDELTGSDYDLLRIGDALKLYNFTPTVLSKKDATRDAIKAKLEALAAIEHGHAGDEFVFYFSGRGSIAPPADSPKALVAMEPTLVPYNGNETNAEVDIRMKVLEDWAKDITDHGGKVTIILDCCFVTPFRSKGIGRQYRETTRCFPRASTSAGEIRDQVYQGPGVFIAASQTKGSAYEELVNEKLHRYAGAFTVRLAGEIIMEIVRQHAVPTYTSVMRNVVDDFKSVVHADYMPGAGPVPTTKDLLANAEVFDKPMFGGVDTSNAIPPAVVQADNEEKSRLEKLRVGLDLDPTFKPGDDKARTAKYDELSKQLRAYVEKNCPFAEYAPKDSLAQIQVSVLPTSSGLQATPKGDLMDAHSGKMVPGASVAAAMDAGLKEYIERRALMYRLFQITSSEKPTTALNFTFQADQSTYHQGDDFTIKLDTGGHSALVYFFSRDDNEPMVQLSFPARGAPDNRFPFQDDSLLSGSLPADNPVGQTLLRLLIVEPSDSISLPHLDPSSDEAFAASMLEYLRVLLPAIEAKKLKWGTKDVTYTILAKNGLK